MNRRLRMAGESAARGTILALAVSLIAGIDLASPAIAQCQYEVTAIISAPPCPFTGPPPLIGRGMNNAGAVVGYFFDCNSSTVDHAFYWSPEKGLLTLPKPEGVTASWAYDINDAGMIVGQMRFSGIGRKGFVYDLATGEYQILEPIHDGAVAEMLSSANAINNAGLVAGNRTISKPGEPNVFNAVIWDTATGEVSDLGLMNGPNSEAVDINAGGDVVGWAGTAFTSADNRAILWVDRRGIDLGMLPGMTKSVGKHLNNSREVIGLSSPPSGIGLHFLWDGGRMSELLPPEGYDVVGSTDFSDAHQMIGHIRIAGTSSFDPFLWQHGEFHNLNTLVVGRPSSLTINHGSVLGDDGSMLARAEFKGEVVAVRLRPIQQMASDLNYDCAVNVYDLEIFIEQWIAQSQNASIGPSADLNGDRVIDALDLLILLSNWG